MRRQSFEKFYYTRVGLGEGCGCAERIIDVYERDRLGIGGSARRAGSPSAVTRAWRRLTRWLRRRAGRDGVDAEIVPDA